MHHLLRLHFALPLFLLMTLLGGCESYGYPGGIGYMGMGSGYGMDTGYGTGGMEMGLHMGGWSDGLGGTWGHDDNPSSADVLDNDPHYTSNYQRGVDYYHPAAGISGH